MEKYLNESEKKYRQACNAIYSLLELELVGQDEADLLCMSLSKDRNGQELRNDVALEIIKTKKETQLRRNINY